MLSALRPFLTISLAPLPVICLYLGLVAIEFYWNVPDWQPRWDIYGFALLWTVATSTAVLCVFVALAVRPFARMASFVLCVLLLVVAFYLFPAEPLRPGLLGRGTISPVWYRSARSGLLLLPTVTLLLREVVRKSRPSGP